MTLGGSLVNLVLVVIKVAAGVLGRSSALVADALHSLSDLASDLVVLVGYRFGRLPEDDSHPYGHGKVETLATAVVGAILLAAGLGMAAGAARTLWTGSSGPAPGLLAVFGAGLSIAVKEGLYRWTARVARETDSRLLLANAWHHRSDALSSVAALAGVGGARWGWPWADPAAAGLVSLLVAKVGWDLGWQALRDLVDTSVEPGTLERLRGIVLGVDGVRGLHGLRARRLGSDVVVDVDIEVDPELNVVQGHEVARAVRAALLRTGHNVRDAMVHVEPVGARDGLYAPSARSEVVARSEALAREEAGVMGLHGTRVVPLETGYLLNLDIEVQPDLTVREAHAIAHRIKEAIRGIPGVADAVIHVDVHGE
ncbi:cation diffusion facilitator family transporter [Deferrisoma palaeochoriense]